MYKLEKLCDFVEDYVCCVNSCLTNDNENSKSLDIDDLILMMNCTDIILNCNDKKNIYKYKKKYSLEQIDKLVEKFLYFLNPEYLDYYILRKDDGTFVFDENFEEAVYAYQHYDFENNDRIIYIPVNHTIEDSFSIVHELFHDINCNGDECDSTGRDYFTEGISILGELLLSDFLKSENIENIDNYIMSIISELRFKALEVNFNLRLILEYLKNGYIDKYMITDIIMSYSEENFVFLGAIINNTCDNGELSLEQEKTYILSYLIAIYMYERVNKNKKYLNELFDLKQVLNDFSFEQVLDYLGVDYNDISLTSESYEKLRKGLVKFIKR